MRQSLDLALRDTLASIAGLRAVVLSVAPDGLIAWSWSSDDRHEIALSFAALERAATQCLVGLGAPQRSRSLLLTAKHAWVASWPLYDDEDDHGEREHLVVTTVYSGALRDGMVMVHGSRIRMRLRAALDAGRTIPAADLRARLVADLLAVDDPGAALRELAEGAGVELPRLARPERLDDDERRRLTELSKARVHRANR